MDPLVIKGEQLLKQEIFMFLTANTMSNAGGVSDFYMNHFIDAEICLNLNKEKYELKRLMLDS